MSQTLVVPSGATSPGRSALLAIAAGVFLLVVVVAPTPGAALAGGIDGCFFRDLNGSSVQGDAENPGGSDEGPFTEPIVVRLDDTASGTFTTTTTDSQTGCFEFDTLTPGVDYELVVEYPADYYSSPTGGDTDVVPSPAVVGDPARARYAFTYTAGADLSISGGVSSVAELSLGYFIVPTGEPMIETGTAPFDTSGNCPTHTSGDDCGQYNDVVRTNDLTTIGYTITATNVPGGGTRPLEGVVLEEVITPSEGAVVEVPSLHPACLTAGVTPPSEIETDADSGVVTVTCNLGAKDNGTSPVPTYIRTDGRSADGSSFVVRARVYAADDRAQVSDSESVLAPSPIQISAMPRFDITKGSDASNPYNSVNYYQTTERINPATGVEEFGVNYQWDISVIYDGGIKGQAALDGPITFSDLIPAEFTGWEIVECKNQPYYFGKLPVDEGDGDWGDRGDWECVEDRVNNEIDITVTNVDTDGYPLPSAGADGTDLTDGPAVAFAGSVKVWYPLSDFYRTVDPSWDYGDPSITGDYELENLVGNFNPTASGLTNFDGVAEPASNNQQSTTVSIEEDGRFSNHVGAFEWADAQLSRADLPDGQAVATKPALYPCTQPAPVDAGSLLERQTQSCYRGDGPVQPGQRAHLWVWLQNHGTSPWASETFKLCDAFDSSTLDLTTWSDGNASFVRVHGIDAEAIVVEFATAEWDDDVANNDWTNQQAAIGTCTAPNDDWNTDPLAFDADPEASLAKVGMVRVTVNPDIHDAVLPNEYAQLSFPVVVRDTFLGGPNDGDPIPVGTILASHANRAFGTTNFSATNGFNPLTNGNPLWGDRMRLNRDEVSVRATVSDDPTDSASDDLSEVRSTDQVVWWLHPTVEANAPYTSTGVAITNTLSAGLEFDSFCQASLPYPHAEIRLESVTENADGTTTLEFDLGDREANAEIGPIPVCTNVGPFLEPGRTLTSDVVIRSDTDVSPEVSRSASRAVQVVADDLLQLTKFVDAPLELQLDAQHYTIGWTNLSNDFVFAPPDVIDVLPYEGDGVNPLNQRDAFDSDFSGSYGLTDWLAQPTTEFVDGSARTTDGTWYYTIDKPSSIPHDADAAANHLSTGSVNWCSQAELIAAAGDCDFGFADATAIRFRQTENLEKASRVKVSFSLQAGGENDTNQPADRYVNRFAARTSSIQHVLESNEVLVQVMAFSLGDLVFHDADVDGRYTPDVDRPASGVSLELWGDDESGNRVKLDMTTTDAEGRYVFDRLVAGTYELRIPNAELSSGSLEGLEPSLTPQPADDDVNEDVDHSATDSGLGYVTSGPVTLNADTDQNPPLGLEPTGENVAGLGDHYTFDNLTNLSVDLGFKGEPAVQLVVEACHPTDTVDCDPTSEVNSADDDWVESVTVGYEESVRWRLTAINTGDEVLTSLQVSDATEASCDRTAASTGDLGLGESYTWVCDTNEVVGGKINTAKLTAAGRGSGTDVEATGRASVEVPSAEPGLTVTKLINDVAAADAPGLVLSIGEEVRFTYSLSTGTSAVPVTDATLTDDNATPDDPNDDWSPSYTSGDANDNDRLDVGEVWLYEASGGVAAAGQHSSSVTATAQPVTAGSSQITADATANYYGIDPDAGLVQLVATVNDRDADEAPGPFVAAGEPAVFHYSLTNTGDVPVEVVGLFDDAGTPDTSSDDWTPTYVSGDLDGDDLLDIDETWRYAHTEDQTVAGAYIGEARASVTASDGRTADVTDPVHYFGASPAISVEHVTSPTDANDSGGDLRWRYTVSNPGNVALRSVTVTDDAGAADDLRDDIVATYRSGDTNGDGLLDPDEEWTFEAAGVARIGSYTRTATVSGVAPSSVATDGSTEPGAVVNDSDDYHHEAPEATLEVVTSVDGHEAELVPGVYVAAGDKLVWTYEITNTGTTPLAQIKVVADGVTTCPSTVLGSGETMTCTSEPFVVIPGQQTNVGSVRATPAQPCDCPERFVAMVDGVTGAQAEAMSVEYRSAYYGVAASVDLIVEVCDLDNAAECQVDDDAHWVDEAVAAQDGSTVWRVTVANTGNIGLVDVTVTDDEVEACEWARATLESGESVAYLCESLRATSAFTNTAVVTAADVTGIVGAVTDTDGASTTVPTSSTTAPGSSTTVPGSSTTVPDSSTTAPSTATTTSGTETTVASTATTTSGTETTVPLTATVAGTVTTPPSALAFTGSSTRGIVLFALLILVAGLVLSTRSSTEEDTPPSQR